MRMDTRQQRATRQRSATRQLRANIHVACPVATVKDQYANCVARQILDLVGDAPIIQICDHLPLLHKTISFHFKKKDEPITEAQTPDPIRGTQWLGKAMTRSPEARPHKRSPVAKAMAPSGVPRG